MYHFFFSILFLFSLLGCVGDYPRLADVPDYTPPSLSTRQAQKEIEELKAERTANKA